jgi:hypothetical protein
MLDEMSTEAIRPLVHNRFKTEHGLVFTTSCFEGKDWSLAPLQNAEDAKTQAQFAGRLGAALGGLGVKRAYAPNPTAFNGHVVAPEELKNEIPLPGGVRLYRYRETPADSTFLTQWGDAGIFSAGGCGKVVVAHRKDCLFGHAGRESLIDRQEVKTLGREKSRPYGVVENMLDALHKRNADMRYVHVWPLYFIKPTEFVHNFDDPDPERARYNRAAGKYFPVLFGSQYGWQDEQGVYIDLPRIARFQAIRCGVLPENIHMEHCYLADDLPTTRNGGGRYLVATVRLS